MESCKKLLSGPILITGASSGIGRAVARLVSAEGAKCVITGRNVARLEETRAYMSGTGHVMLPMDLCRGHGCLLVEKAIAAVGPISGFVHCAGIEKTLPFRITELSDLHEIMAINFESFWEILQAMLKRGNYVSGNLSVVAISSVAVSGTVGNTAYAASKGAIVAFIKSLAAEYASKKIRFNCVCPGYTDTPMLQSIKKLYKTEEDFGNAIVKKHPLGLGSPDDVASAVKFLLSDASRWITGSVLTVDGGYSVR